MGGGGPMKSADRK